MKKLLPVVFLLLTPFSVHAGRNQDCNSAIDDTALLMRTPLLQADRFKDAKLMSNPDRQAFAQATRKLIDSSERIIRFCDLDQEMTERVIDQIIANKKTLDELNKIHKNPHSH